MEFQQDCPKDKKLQLFQFFGGNLEKFRSTEHYGAALELKKLQRSKLFLSMVFKHGLLEGSTSEQM